MLMMTAGRPKELNIFRKDTDMTEEGKNAYKDIVSTVSTLSDKDKKRFVKLVKLFTVMKDLDDEEE